MTRGPVCAAPILSAYFGDSQLRPAGAVPFAAAGTAIDSDPEMRLSSLSVEKRNSNPNTVMKIIKHLPKFLGEFLRHPSTMGAVTPSSLHLAKAITDWIDFSHAEVVLEYGPGTGIFTDFIVRRLPPGARFAAIEINGRMAEIFRRRHPSLTLVEDSVGNVAEICRRLGFEGVDCIVCGLPWSSFPLAQQTAFLEQIMAVLRPGGQFVTFAYLEGLLLPAGRKFPRLLHRYFHHVSKSRIIWRNLTPAFVYQCKR